MPEMLTTICTSDWVDLDADLIQFIVLDLCCNQLNGSIPMELGSLKKLSTLSLQNNRLNGRVPAELAEIPLLEHLDLQNNTLSGPIPPALKRLNERHYDNNPGLCGAGFEPLKDCNATLDGTNIYKPGSHKILDWSTRLRVINGIAKGIEYLHGIELYSNKLPIVHQNISTNKVVRDERFNPLITDSGLPRLLADDIVFSNLKVSAAIGYLAPEYITTGRFTEKSDIYAFGVIILQILARKHALSSKMRLAAEGSKFNDFMDPNKLSFWKMRLLCWQNLHLHVPMSVRKKDQP